MRPLACKLLTLLVTAILLLSLTLPAFARRPNHLRRFRDLDEQPYPAGGAGKVAFFVVLKTANGFVLIPVFVKASRVSDITPAEGSTASSRKNEIVE